MKRITYKGGVVAMAIKIMKPIKHTRQKNETPTDAEGLLKFVSEIACGSDTKNDVRIVSNNLCNPRDFINHPDRVTDQMIELQKLIGVEDDNRGKRIYPMTYKLPKNEYGVDIDEAEDMASKLLEKHSNFQSIAAISENESDITICVVFNNYSADGAKMTKCYKPYNMSNIYNKNHKFIED